MKKLLITACFILIAQLSWAQCASYQSAFPPPYPSTSSCMSTFLGIAANSFCCTTEFDAWCITQFKQSCNNSSHPCTFAQCKSGSCADNFMPFCPSPCNSYGTATPPPGPNPPTSIDGIIFEIIYFDGACCMDTWDGLCTSAMDSIACLVCNDNNVNTIDAASSLLGCTHTPIPTTTTPYVEVKAKVFLEGAYISNSQGLMRTDLRTANLLPAAQPFNISPWSYAGTENSGSISANAVDWVLLELRDTKNPSCVVGKGAGILLNNGQICSVSNTSRGVRINGAMPNSNYYVVVRARHHVAVMSAMPVFCSNTVAYDFTYAVNGAKGTNQQKQLESFTSGGFTTLYCGLKAGDFNGDGNIITNANAATSDFMLWKSHASTIRQYNKTDCNYDLMVTNKDYNMCFSNSGHTGETYILNPNPTIATCPACL